MRIQLQIVPAAIPDFNRWRASLPGRADDQRRLAKWHLEAIAHTILKNPAVIPGLSRVATSTGESFDWHYLPDLQLTLSRRRVSRTMIEVKLIRLQHS